MKKAQFEILGLSFIVILLTLGVLFGVYVLSKPERQLTREFSENQLAANWLNTYKGMSTSCHDATVTRLLTDCATTRQIDCGGEDSCSFVRTQTDTMLEATLGDWNRVYNLTFEGPGGIGRMSFANFPCVGREKQSDLQPIPTSTGTIFVTLTLCGT